MKLNEKLIVEIPKEYKDNLNERWQLENWKWDIEIRLWFPKIKCELCETFEGNNCQNCLFKKFGKNERCGCIYWIRLLVPKFRYGQASPVKFKAMINKLRREAIKYIKWV